MKSRNPLRRLNLGWLPTSRFASILAWVGAAIFAVQIWTYAHTQQSILDEGAYLVKGYLFATGRYQPFQFYGPWTNHMPLSYLVSGYAQVLFGPGLRTGRYLAVFLGLAFLFGLWLVARRFGGGWWAAAAVWAVALDPAVIKMYSVLASQGLIACMLVWILALVLGENRPRWQLLLGAAMAGSIPLTRINMTPVLPFVLGYIFWEHGRRAGVWSSILGMAAFLGGHALYWPNILTLWVAWLPEGLTPFLEAWRPDLGVNSWQPVIGPVNRLWSFLEGLRFHFIPLLGTLAAVILWPPKRDWKKQSNFRAAVFLLGLFVTLWGMHAWASLGKNYCVFCYSVYLSFFSFLGILLVAVSFPSWVRQPSKWRKIVILLVILGVSTGIGFGLVLDFSESLFSTQFVRRFIRTEIPRFDGLRILPGKVELQAFLANYFGWDYREVQLQVKRALTTLVLTLGGLGIGCFVLAAAKGFGRLLNRGLENAQYGRQAAALVLFLLAGLALSPTVFLGGGRRAYDCDSDVIASYEAAGAHLAERIPPGSLVYWRGGLSTVPLLYLEGVEIFPPQLNNDYSFRIGGNPDTLVKYGLWNDELAHRWAGEADFVLVEERFYQGWLIDEIRSRGLDLLEPTPRTAACRKDSAIHIFWSEP